MLAIPPSTVTENRDPAFWLAVAQRPEVAELLGTLATGDEMATVLSRPDILPLAAAHGGFLFQILDPFQRLLELHTLFTPEGWGREVNLALKDAIRHVFARGAVAIITHQMAANPKSQPPRSFGFVPLGEYAASPHGDARTWILTEEAWDASPGARPCRSQH